VNEPLVAGDPSVAETFERCLAVGGVVVFPADTVYGLACDPGNRFAVERLYLLKRRSLGKPSAVMFFDVSLALEALPELGEQTRTALTRLLPGGVSVLLPNPAERFPLACGADPTTIGLRVPNLPALAGVRWPVLQSSANRAGGPDPRTLAEVPELLRAAADLVIDGGALPGTASTVIDLRGYEQDGSWSIVRPGAISESRVATALSHQFHFDPATYPELIRDDIPVYERLQDELAAASGTGASRILELGTGTGETAARLLGRHPEASLVGVDESAAMLAVASEALPGERVELRVGRLEESLPDGPFDLVASALCVHHLDGVEKADLFGRIASALAPGGRFVLADVVVPVDPAGARTSLTPGFDKPSPLADQLAWMEGAGFDAVVAWESGDLAVVVAELRR
jgi:tRNA threonylcarbamoyl adenosine modification protein (Sua5/YciO/YrdC/YwlC family)